MIPGQAVELAAGVRRLVANNGGMMTGPGTNTYLLGHDRFTVLDPGPDEPEHLRALLEATGGNIGWIVVTHTHRDHSPLARALAARTGAEVIGMPPPLDDHQDTAFAAHRSPADGERLQLGETCLLAIHTPGHASNCVCYLLERERMLFTGDHILEGVTPVILPPDGDMAAYMRSLEAVAERDFETIAPGHGRLITRGKRMIELVRTHRLARESKALRCLQRLGEATLERLTAAVYDDVPVDRHRWAQRTLEAHLLKLLGEKRVTRHEAAWRVSAG